MSRDSVLFPVDIDTKKYTAAMKIISKKALPDAIAETLNRTADATTKQQIKNVKREFTVRTKYTLKSMESRGARPFKALNKARGNNINRMFSRAGTFSKYLWMQEEDNTKKGMNGPVPIPTLKARTGKSIKKSIRKKYRLSPGQNLSGGEMGDNMFIGKPKGRNQKGVYLRGPRKNQLTMLRNLDSNEVKIKGTGFHSKAVKKYGTKQFISAQYKKIVLRTLKRKRVQ